MASSFTNEQKAAIEAPVDVPIAIVACPGSGKTFTIINRITYLFQNGFRPSDLLAITFTRKAAAELRSRVAALSYDVNQLTVNTFHSFGLSILKRFGHLIGIKTFRVISEREQASILRSVFPNEQFPESQKKILLMLQVYKSNGICKNPDYKQYFDKYQSILNSEGACDFSDLILKSNELVHHNPEVCSFYQRRFKYALVDEMQDVSKAQFDLMQALFGDRGCLTVVGDDDQTIYSWRGADASLLLNFKTVYPTCELKQLTQCFRCDPHIVRTMNMLIKCNKKRVQKKVQSICNIHTGKHVKALFVRSIEHEAIEVCNMIQKIRKGSVGILFRTVKSSLAVKKELDKRKIKISARIKRSGSVERVLNTIDYVLGRRKDNSNTFETTVSAEYLRSAKVPDAVNAVICELKEKDEFVKILANDAVESRGESLEEFLDRERLEADDEIGESDIHLSTVHQAKGLEYDYVFIIGACKNKWPSMMENDPDKIEEERRVFYVAMSRARHDLVISFYGKPSPFLGDIEGFLEVIECEEQIHQHEEKEEIKPRMREPATQPMGFTSVKKMAETGGFASVKQMAARKDGQLTLLHSSQSAPTSYITKKTNAPQKKKVGPPQLSLFIEK